MHLQGHEIVSEPTRRSARHLVGTGLTVFLAKLYGLDLTGLTIFEVAIDPKVIAGAAIIVVLVQLATFLVHWLGDFASIAPWNSKQRVNGIARLGVGAHLLTKLDAAMEQLETFQKPLDANTGRMDGKVLQEISTKIDGLKNDLEALKRSAIRYSRFVAFYFFGLYLTLPVVTGLLALFWPGVAP